MVMKPSFLSLNRLKIISGAKIAYDQKFHLGVNIIRGKNGSGKSTISDFIFFVLGGEFDDWKTSAKRCQLVQAEVTTADGVLTIRRYMEGKQSPAFIYYGDMESGDKAGIEEWHRFPIRRVESQESFSQIMFRAMRIPEAQSQGSANVTMHQIMRLLYSDQRTPASRLFRFEGFDTREIREAVGDLICGLNVYELYDLQLKLRDLDKKFSEKNLEWSKLQAAVPHNEALDNVDTLNNRLASLSGERDQLLKEIENVDSLVSHDEVKKFSSTRKQKKEKILKEKEEIRSIERKVEQYQLELEDLYKFINYLEGLADTLNQTEVTAQVVGNIEFKHCPACISPLKSKSHSEECIVCGSKIDLQKEQSRYLQVKNDIAIQLRESGTLKGEKESSINKLKAQLVSLRRSHADHLSQFLVDYEVSFSPRESYLADRNRRLGQIEREAEYISRLREVLIELDKVSHEKSLIQADIDNAKARKKALETNGFKRRAIALTKISSLAKEMLHLDLKRQEEFINAENVELFFGDDAIQVDGQMNFAESSNVILKNTAIFSLYLAATSDPLFFHPRFLLLDNIEDKGMEQVRSHNFQKIIVDYSSKISTPHQIIFTTSMMNPELEKDELTIGPSYTTENKTLNFNDVPSKDV